MTIVLDAHRPAQEVRDEVCSRRADRLLARLTEDAESEPLRDRDRQPRLTRRQRSLHSQAHLRGNILWIGRYRHLGRCFLAPQLRAPPRRSRSRRAVQSRHEEQCAEPDEVQHPA